MKKIISTLALFSLLNIQITFQTNVLKVELSQAVAAEQQKSTTNTKQKSEQMETQSGGDFMNIITMMVMGYILSRQVVTYMAFPPIPTDVMVAAGSGIIYVGGEIYALNAYKKMKDDKIDYVVTEDGSANEDQIEYLNKQKESYQDVIKTAKTKKMIQLAAAAGLLGAAAVSYFMEATLINEELQCIMCGPTTNAAFAAYYTSKTTPLKSLVKAPQLQTSAAALPTGCASDIATICTASLGSSCAVQINAEKGCIKVAALQAPLNAAGSPITMVADNKTLDGQMMNGLVGPQILSQIMREFNEAPIETANAKKYLDQYGALDLFKRGLTFSEVKDENLSPRDYFVARETNRYFEGEISSSSIEEYYSFNRQMSVISDSAGNFGLETFLKLAMQEGLDLIIPNSYASGFMGMTGAALAVAVAMTFSLSTTFDMWMTVPVHRAIVYGGMAAAAYVSTRSIDNVIKKAEGNIEKIDSIIKKLLYYGTEKKNDGSYKMLSQGSFKPFDKGRAINISDGTTKMSCVVEGSKPGACGSLGGAIKNSSTFASLPNGFATTIGSIGDSADAFQGSSTLKSGTLASLDTLGGKNNALSKIVKDQQKKLNSQLAKAGKKPIPFEELSNKFRAKMNKAVQDTLNNKGMTPEGFLASAGVAAPIEVQKEKAQEVAAVNTEALKNAGLVDSKANANSGMSDFKFTDLDSEESNGMEATDDAVAALNESRESQDDIIKNKDVSIFKVISTRYLKSGYPRLLEEIKK